MCKRDQFVLPAVGIYVNGDAQISNMCMAMLHCRLKSIKQILLQKNSSNIKIIWESSRLESDS